MTGLAVYAVVLLCFWTEVRMCWSLCGVVWEHLCTNSSDSLFVSAEDKSVFVYKCVRQTLRRFYLVRMSTFVSSHFIPFVFPLIPAPLCPKSPAHLLSLASFTPLHVYTWAIFPQFFPNHLMCHPLSAVEPSSLFLASCLPPLTDYLLPWTACQVNNWFLKVLGLWLILWSYCVCAQL